MKNVLTYITKGSKLIVIYILTVLISGSILTYLSINNISNFEELTEKRITEEEKTTIELYSQGFQSTLEQLSESLVKRMQQVDLTKEKGNLLSDEKLVRNYMVVNKNGVLVRPHFIPSSFELNYYDTSFSYTQRYQQGEQSEFVQKDYSSAENLYTSSLKYTIFKSDSAKVYNALARLKIKKR